MTSYFPCSCDLKSIDCHIGECLPAAKAKFKCTWSICEGSTERCYNHERIRGNTRYSWLILESMINLLYSAIASDDLLTGFSLFVYSKNLYS